MRRPTMRLAYCTGMRRCACSTKTTEGDDHEGEQHDRGEDEHAVVLLQQVGALAGMRAAIEVKISTDMPLPMPRSVISSPSHMITAVPAVMVTTRTRIRNRLSSGMMSSGAVGEQPLRAASAMMPVDCRTARAIVR